MHGYAFLIRALVYFFMKIQSRNCAGVWKAHGTALLQFPMKTNNDWIYFVSKSLIFSQESQRLTDSPSDCVINVQRYPSALDFVKYLPKQSYRHRSGEQSRYSNALIDVAQTTAVKLPFSCATDFICLAVFAGVTSTFINSDCFMAFFAGHQIN